MLMFEIYEYGKQIDSIVRFEGKHFTKNPQNGNYLILNQYPLFNNHQKAHNFSFVVCG